MRGLSRALKRGCILMRQTRRRSPREQLAEPVAHAEPVDNFVGVRAYVQEPLDLAHHLCVVEEWQRRGQLIVRCLRQEMKCLPTNGLIRVPNPHDRACERATPVSGSARKDGIDREEPHISRRMIEEQSDLFDHRRCLLAELRRYPSASTYCRFVVAPKQSDETVDRVATEKRLQKVVSRAVVSTSQNPVQERVRIRISIRVNHDPLSTFSI